MGNPINHSKRLHALLSASGSERWLNCTPSASLEEKHGKREVSAYAEEGTLAHEFADLSLKHFHGEIKPSAYQKKLKQLRANKLYTDEMEGQVAKYVSYCIEEFVTASKKGGVAVTEQRVDFSHYVPDGFGTGDYAVIADEVIKVIDLKYGKGVAVSAAGNPQLKLYAIGQLNKYELLYNIKKVELVIFQPRLDSVSNWVVSVEDLYAWAEEVVKPAAAKATKGEGEQVAGEWCKWCTVKHKCKALAALATQAAKNDFQDPFLLDEAEIIKAFENMKLVQDWFSSVVSYMLSEAKKGKTWKGYKLVPTLGNRKWKNEEAITQILLKNGFTLEMIQNKKLKGIGDISNLMSIDKFNELLSDMVVKPAGEPVLVPESDKRHGIGLASARQDFKD